ncbi:MAG: hypothetical protein Kow0081_0070 [Candidatus Dojkabacteria bacterium]
MSRNINYKIFVVLFFFLVSFFTIFVSLENRDLNVYAQAAGQVGGPCVTIQGQPPCEAGLFCFAVRVGAASCQSPGSVNDIFNLDVPLNNVAEEGGPCRTDGFGIPLASGACNAGLVCQDQTRGEITIGVCISRTGDEVDEVTGGAPEGTLDGLCRKVTHPILNVEVPDLVNGCDAGLECVYKIVGGIEEYFCESSASPITDKSNSLSGQGVACEKNYIDCSEIYGPKFRNLIEDIRSEYINTNNVAKEIVVREIVEEAREGFEFASDTNICYDSTLISRNIFMLYLEEAFSLNTANRIGYLHAGPILGGNKYINFCPYGLFPTPGINKYEILGDPGGLGLLKADTVYGCCPAGYAFVNTKSASSFPESNTIGGCCRGSASEYSHYDSSGKDKCVKKDGSKIMLPEAGANDIGALLDEIRTTGRPSLDMYSVDYSGVGTIDQSGILWGIPLGYTTNSNVADVYDVGLIRVKEDHFSSSKRCPNIFDENACMLLADNSVVPNGDGLVNRTCIKCFHAGEPIGITDSRDGLRVCDTSAPGNVRVQPLINGNLQDTLAWLAADEANRPILQGCRERGGIYTAIGCIDPTPIGIITGIIRITLGIIGGVALIQIILAGVAFQSGQEAQIEAAKKRLFATFGGLLLLIFSVLILRIIGVNVLDVLPEGIF